MAADISRYRNLMPGALNPNLTPRSGTPIARPDNITDDSMAVYRRTFRNIVSPNIFEGVNTFRGIVLQVFTPDGNVVDNISQENSGDSLVYRCMIPELDLDKPNPFAASSKEEYINICNFCYPASYAAMMSNNALGMAVAPIGSIVHIRFDDPSKTFGVVTGIEALGQLDIETCFGPNAGAREAHNSGGPIGPSLINDAETGSNSFTDIPTIQTKSGVDPNVTAEVNSFLQIIGNIASNNGYPKPTVTSGYRSPESQVNTMAGNWASPNVGNQSTSYLSGLYSDKEMAAELNTIFQNNYDPATQKVTSAGVAEATQYWKNKYAGGGGSSHVVVDGESKAVDLRFTTGIDEILNNLALPDLAAAGIEISVLRESDHFHVKVTQASSSTTSESTETQGE